MEQRITALISKFFVGFYFPEIGITDIIEVIILTFLISRLLFWLRNTKAWTLIRGIMIILVMLLVAFVLQLNTILFLAKNTLTILATAAVVVFQPELRRALERLGEQDYFSMISMFEKNKEKTLFSDYTLDEIVAAVYSMSAVKTGALIVMEKATPLEEYESTGIKMDCLISSQVLVNIFEHNTPLHDGAIIVKGDRILSATCYLPLSDNYSLSKALGTRHRAAVGLSEVSDALVIVVSEETGAVSVAEYGKISRNLKQNELIQILRTLQKSNQSSGEDQSTGKEKFIQYMKGTGKKWKKN